MYPQSIFEQKYEKYLNFLSENFPFFGVKFSIYLNRRVFIMKRSFVILHQKYSMWVLSRNASMNFF